MALEVVTNNVPRPVLEFHYLSEAEAGEFDYIDGGAVERGEVSPSFFRYRGQLYDLGEFVATPNGREPARLELNELAAWDGYLSESFFSGLVVRWPAEDGRADFESVIVGRYCC